MRVSFLRPMAQFSGADRLLQRLRAHLRHGAYSHLRIAVAFAKIGPLLRLEEDFNRWRRTGRTIEVVVGIDLQGTSRQALEFALQNFDVTYVIHTTASAVFHPKFYLFYGEAAGVCVCGSHNLTVGGTETNLEAGVQIELMLPEDEEVLQNALALWESLLPESCQFTRRLDEPLLGELLRHDLVHDEAAARPRAISAETVEAKAEPSTDLFPRVVPKPPTPIPRSAFGAAAPLIGRRRMQPRRPGRAGGIPPPTQALVIQIIPHHNGEVFLSKLALNENPAFFEFPFTGRTVPKRPGNPAYPQRIPDPVVTIKVFGASARPLVAVERFSLNTVYYKRKAEIRITFSPGLTRQVEQFAVMVMRKAQPPLDYEMEIHNSGSTQYGQFLEVCNRELPSGGARRPRRYGWL